MGDEIIIDGKGLVNIKVRFPASYGARLRLAGLVIRFGVWISGGAIKVEV